MTPSELNDLYVQTLERVQPQPKTIRHMVREARRRAPRTWRPERPTWVWSDLHLHHRNIIGYTNRPFADRSEMDDALHAAWRDNVGTEEVVLCVGDVALAGSLKGEELERVSTTPGHKLLVLGNHEFTRKGEVAPTGFDEHCMVLLAETDPPLAFTHVPLTAVPAGMVNVHGHVHNNVPLREGRYINVCVEHTNYKPIRLERIVRLAKELAAGRSPRGDTTMARLNAAEKE